MGMGVGKFTGTITGIGTVYDINKKIEIDLNYSPRTARFLAHVSAINIQGIDTSSSSHPTRIFCKISEDPEGDQFVLTETETDVDTGLSDSTQITAIIKIDIIIALDRADTVYAHLKTDHGTITAEQVMITWEDKRN